MRREITKAKTTYYCFPYELQQFLEHGPKEEPLFVSDKPTIFDVSAADPEELIKRCSES